MPSSCVQCGLDKGVKRPHFAAISGRAPRSPDSSTAPIITTIAAAPPLQLQPLRDAGLPAMDDASFAEQSERLAEHRARVSGYAAESKWPRQI